MILRLLDDPDFAASRPAEWLAQQPLGFLDVGARGEVHEVVEPLAELTAVLGFEPDRAECERLRRATRSGPWARYELEPCALGATAGPATLHRLEAPTNDSLLPPNTAITERYRMQKFAERGRESITTQPLDRVLFEARAGEPSWGEFIKLDTQGSELEILKGAERTLRERTLAILCEVSFFEIYAGQALFSDVEAWLRRQGFAFYGFNSWHTRSRKQLDKLKESGRERAMYADAVFLRDPLDKGAVVEGSERRACVLFCCSLLLGYYDFALEIALSTWAHDKEAQRIEAVVRRCAALEPGRAQRDVEQLAARIWQRPERANVEVGRFVDTRRDRNDYDDVLD